MNFRVLIADDSPFRDKSVRYSGKLARGTFVREIDMFDVPLYRLTIAEATLMLNDRGKLPPGFDVVLVRAI